MAPTSRHDIFNYGLLQVLLISMKLPYSSPWPIEHLMAALLFVATVQTLVASPADDNVARPGESDSISSNRTSLAVIFTGYYTSAGGTMFALVEVGENGREVKSGWRAKNESLGDLRIVDFDSKAEILFVQRGPAEILKLSLQDSRVLSMKAPELTRDQAKQYLEGLLQQSAPKYDKYPESTVSFDVDSTASEEEKAILAYHRSKAAKQGQMLIVGRKPDGGLHFGYMNKYSKEMIPTYVAKNLTEADWGEFELKMAMTAYQNVHNRTAAEKKINHKPTKN